MCLNQKSFYLVTVAVLNSVLQKQYWLQSAVSSCVVGYEQIVVSCKIVSNRMNTIKQGILYWTCTGLAVEVIGLVPTRD